MEVFEIWGLTREPAVQLFASGRGKSKSRRDGLIIAQGK